MENAFELVCLDSEGRSKFRRVLLMAKTTEEKRLWLKHLSQYIPCWEEISEERKKTLLGLDGPCPPVQRKLTGMQTRDSYGGGLPCLY